MITKVNGSQDAISTTSTFTSSFTDNVIQIGAGNNSGFINGSIAEVLIYNRVLTATEQTQVEKYLMDKYAPPVNLGLDINDAYGFENITLSSTGYFTNYSWSGSTTATTPTISVNNPGQYILEATDIFGRVSRDTINVIRPDYAAVQLTNQTLCYNGITSVSAPIPIGDYQFVQWSDGVTNQTRSITQTINLSYTIKDNANFTRTSNVATFTYDNSLQNVSLGNDTTLCQGNLIQLAQTSPTISSYLWSTGATTNTILVNTTGEYRLSVSATNGCIKEDTIQIVIQGLSPTIAFTIPSQFCENEIALFSETSFVQNGDAISSRLWNFGNNTNSNLSSGSLSNHTAGTYNGLLTVTSISGCQSSQSFSYVVRPKPSANYTSPLLCDNVVGEFTNTSTSSQSVLISSEWFVNDFPLSTATNFSYSHPTLGSYNLKLVVTNTFGCRDTSSQIQQVINTYSVPISPSLIDPFNEKTILSNEQVPLSWSTVDNNYFYELQFSNSSNFSPISNTISTVQNNYTWTPNTVGTIYWRVKANNPCILGGTSPIFSINSIQITDSLRMWLRADEGVTTVSSAVSQWNDLSGNSLNFSQSTAIKRPSFSSSSITLGGKPSLDFDGIDDQLNSTLFSGISNSSCTVFILGSGNNQNISSAVYLGVNTNANGFWLMRRATNERFGLFHKNGLLQGNSVLPQSGYNFRIFSAIKSLNTSLITKVNGSQDAISTTSTFTSSFTDNVIQIGAGNNSAFINGSIAEVLIYNRVLTATEQTQIEKYLMDKYAPPISLGADITSNYGFCDTLLTPKGYFTNYLWSNGATSSTLTVNQPGTYWLTATDIFGRVSSDTLQLIRPVYDSISLQNQIVCFNNLINETAFVPTGYSFVNWNDGDTNQTKLLTENELLSYTVADTSNCQLTSNSVSITIDSSLFDISLGADTNLCVGNTIELQQTNSFITSYLWNTGNSNPIQTLDTAGVYILEVQNQNNCSNRDSIEITIDGFSPEIVFNFPVENCQFSEVLFSETSTVQGSSIASTSWTIGSQTPILNSNGQITFNQPGIVPVQLELVSAQNCRSIDTFTITVHPKPIVNFTTVNYCPYQDIVFNSTNLASSQLINYDWNFGQSSSSSNTSQQENPSHIYGLEGTYSVNLKVIDEYGCKDTLIQDVLIQPAPISNFSVQNTCENTLVEFTNISSIPSGYSITSNLWNYGDNTTAINPTIGKEYAAYGDYVIELITIGNNGCSDTSNQSVTIYPNPILNWNISPSCKNTLTVFEDLSTIPEGTLVSTDWLVNLQYPFTTPIASYRFATLGEQYLNLTSTSDQNCTSDTLILVNVNPELNANFSYSPTIVVAGVPVTFTDLSIGSTTATWDLGIGEELITYTPPVTQFAKVYPLEWVDSTVDLTLFVENQIGCKDTITKTFGVQGPAFDLEVKSLFIQEINGFNTVGVEFENVGTISINKIDFELSGLNTLPIQETWNGTLLPNQDQIYMFNAKLSAYNSIQDELINFLCVEGIASDILGNVDVIKENNKVCENTENEDIALLSVSPNPTENTTNVSLLIPNKTEQTFLNVSLYNMSGEIVQYVIDNQVVEPGIFDFDIDFSNLSRGIYLLKIDDGATKKVLRVSKI